MADTTRCRGCELLEAEQTAVAEHPAHETRGVRVYLRRPGPED